MEICDATATQRQQVLDFGTEIQATLQKITGSISSSHSSDSSSKDATTNAADDNASLLETIKSLTSGDKVKAAMELSSGLDGTAAQCVQTSKQLIDLLEAGMDSLPQYVICTRFARESNRR